MWPYPNFLDRSDNFEKKIKKFKITQKSSKDEQHPVELCEIFTH
jgi:hypothetical protein